MPTRQRRFELMSAKTQNREGTRNPALPESLPQLLHAEQLDHEGQLGVRRDHWRMTGRAVGQVGWNDQLPLAADLHAGYAFVPALDDSASPERERERLIAIMTAIEFLAILE